MEIQANCESWKCFFPKHPIPPLITMVVRLAENPCILPRWCHTRKYQCCTNTDLHEVEYLNINNAGETLKVIKELYFLISKCQTSIVSSCQNISTLMKSSKAIGILANLVYRTNRILIGKLNKCSTEHITQRTKDTHFITIFLSESICPSYQLITRVMHIVTQVAFSFKSRAKQGEIITII